MSASSRTLRVITSRIAPPQPVIRSVRSAGSDGRGGARPRERDARARPERQVDLGAELGEAQRVLAVARRKLLSDVLHKPPGLASRLLVLHQPRSEEHTSELQS